jgi:methylated-DNA-[protein]-cysteine S-methyltransferase
MQKIIKYVIFKTKWGDFGLVGRDSAILRTYLPGWSSKAIRAEISREMPEARFDANFSRSLQDRIKAYFEGEPVEFNADISVDFNGRGKFGREVLNTCRKIGFGRVRTYSQLAGQLGRPAAGRAVGNALAKNPLPLIIPCHRVIRSDGKIGGFTAPGGTDLKTRLLMLEKR